MSFANVTFLPSVMGNFLIFEVSPLMFNIARGYQNEKKIQRKKCSHSFAILEKSPLQVFVCLRCCRLVGTTGEVKGGEKWLWPT